MKLGGIHESDFEDDEFLNIPKVSEVKSKFRSSKKWKDFRKTIIFARGCRCQMCGLQYKKQSAAKLQLHHRYPEDYELLNPDFFAVLCYTCHEYVEFMIRRISGRKFLGYNGFDKVLYGLSDFLTFTAREKGEYIIAEVMTKQNKQ